MIKRFASVAAIVAVLSFAGQANASYTLTLSGLNPLSAGANGTSFVFAVPTSPQASVGDIAQPFNVINVTEPTASASGSGFVTLSENFSITGTGSQAGLGTTTGTITGTFNISGAFSTYGGTITNLVTTGGSGFAVQYLSYTQPTAGDSGTGTAGNVSIGVTPLSTVPEPASIAMLGLGLAGVGAYGLRRRSAK